MEFEAETLFQGQVQVWKNIYSYVDYMALKCAVELGIPDILQSENRPMSLTEIASKITNAPSPDILYLSRIMRLLAHNKVFSSKTLPSSDVNAPPAVTRYGPTSTSQWLVRDKNALSLAPILLLQNHPLLRNPWDKLSTCVREGGHPFHKAHGRGMYDLATQDAEFRKIFDEAMGSTGKVTAEAIVSAFDRDAWNGLESIVDVGGGNGRVIADIVKSYPHIRALNFDLPDVVAGAPELVGVSHVGGDMFDSIPTADAVFMKWIIHNWDDESCVKMLKNCKKAIPEKTGKLFIVDLVLNPDGDEVFGRTGLAFDLVMMALTTGKLRTEPEWKSLLQRGGFPRYKITHLPTFYSIIQAYPN